MRKPSILILLLSVFFFYPIFLFANVWQDPLLIYQTHSSIEIQKVLFSRDKTSVEFRVRENSDTSFCVHSSIFASDEQGIRYPILYVEGIQLDTSIHPSNGKDLFFTLHFKPLPTTTHVFDIIEGRQGCHFRIYGIHDHKKKLEYKKPLGEISLMETATTLFQPDTAVIQGVIHGYNHATMPHDMTVHYNCEQFHMNNGMAKPNIAVINDDGTFSCSFLMDRPAWNNLSFGENQFYYYYIRPGDTLNIVIENYGQWNEKVTYTNCQGKPSYQALINEGEIIYGSLSLLLKSSKDAFQKTLAEYGRIAEQLQAYLSHKYQLTPWEIQLFQTQQCLQFAYLQAYYMNEWDFQQKKQGYPVESSNEDYSFIHQIPWNDSTLPILKSWNNASIYHFLTTRVNIHSINPIVQRDIEEKRIKAIDSHQ